MNSFKIFIKQKEFYWSNTKVILLIYFVSIILLIVKREFYDSHKNIFDVFMIAVLFGNLFYGFVLKLLGLATLEPLYGRFEGFLVFNFESIVINSKSYKMNEIKQIVVNNFDYKQKFLSRGRFEFIPNLSQGNKNNFVLKLNTNEVIKCFFEQNYADDMNLIQPILIHYHLIGKFSGLHLFDILKISDYDEIQDFKNMYLKN